MDYRTQAAQLKQSKAKASTEGSKQMAKFAKQTHFKVGQTSNVGQFGGNPGRRNLPTGPTRAQIKARIMNERVSSAPGGPRQMMTTTA